MGQTKQTHCTEAARLGCELAAPFAAAPTKPHPICAESVAALTSGPSYLNTAAESVAGCRVMETVASDTVQSRVAEETPPKGCEAESALVRRWGWGETACPSVQATTSSLST